MSLLRQWEERLAENPLKAVLLYTYFRSEVVRFISAMRSSRVRGSSSSTMAFQVPADPAVSSRAVLGTAEGGVGLVVFVGALVFRCPLCGTARESVPRERRERANVENFMVNMV